MSILIEACVDSVESARAAEKGGADRLELNCALELDGLTPSPGLYGEVTQATMLPVIVMIRPRNNGFMYSEAEYRVMLRDIDVFIELGAAGIAVGCLKEDLSIDAHRTAEFVARAGNMEVVFHRAFDVTPDVVEALETLVDCGVRRVLTSGQAGTAPEGAPRIAQLVELARNRIEVLPGSGINASNARSLIAATGCRQVHGTFKAGGSNAAALTGLDRLRATASAGTDAGMVAAVRKALERV